MKIAESVGILIFISIIISTFAEESAPKENDADKTPYSENIDNEINLDRREVNGEKALLVALNHSLAANDTENSKTKPSSLNSSEHSSQRSTSSPSSISTESQTSNNSDHESSTFTTTTILSRSSSSNSTMRNDTEHILATGGSISTQNTTPSSDDVVLKPDKIPTFAKAILEKSIAWMNDTYTMSIVFPIAAGFVFAAVVIVLVSFVNCLRRRCCRRRFRRKILPDTIRNMKPSDRARLLAETSDEEF